MKNKIIKILALILTVGLIACIVLAVNNENYEEATFWLLMLDSLILVQVSSRATVLYSVIK